MAAQDVRRRLDAWYREHGRHGLPWRQTRDAYAVLVSEVMLQQTQVERVLPFYRRWLEAWPAPAPLAASSPAEVIRAWSGLGYNRRALYLHRAAGHVVEHHAGRVPFDGEALRRLPGVGAYTAAAVASFAGARRVAVADTNIARVLARVALGRERHQDCAPAAIRETADGLLPRGGEAARDHNLALMDLGALVCTASAPICDGCPLVRGCAWRTAGYPASVRVRRPAPRFEETARFARGRIVEGLRREVALDLAGVRALLPPRHAARAEEYLLALAAEGLVEKIERAWVLPGGGHAQGRMSMASPKL